MKQQCDQLLRHVAVICLLLLSSLAAQPQSVVIHHIDVGQGDATFIVARDGAGNISRTVLIDGGLKRCGQTIINYLTGTLHITHINAVIASHYDNDHVGGLAVILTNAVGIVIDSVFDRGDILFPHPAKGAAYRTAAIAYGNRRATLIPGKSLVLFYDNTGGTHTIQLSCLCVNGSVYNPNGNFNAVSTIANPDENDLSTGFLLTYGKFRYLTCGDIGGKHGQQAGTCAGTYGCNFADLETNVIGQSGPVSAYKINHHGSRCSTNAAWVSGAKAAVAIISSGRNGTYKHPRPEVIALLQTDPDMQAYYMTSEQDYYQRLGNKGVLNNPHQPAIDLSVQKETNHVDITTTCNFSVGAQVYTIN
ncbi:Metal-dependent hydrolase, beta-lactamase superfamily II [Mucilaginibacter mallensis]|uniref:Metal-dependent hydrolase, beta-lactamase superfamily II n=1 Tax=Mucilaginibacter mallensis TaxID=652787 RepID=A0A1H2BEC2_MUCMA|nr:hypothetical protein [Mucilaginibacter mallensis]SDT56146.1 Metal-dependent hydrolase, beta-lactamase superfamily II [Mucilaginibacter mallensis]